MKHIKYFLTLLLFSTALFGAITNVAPQGAATQASKYIAGTVPSRAIDNDTNGAWPNVASTGGSTAYDWWYLDLGDQYAIDSIKIFARTDCSVCEERLQNVRVMVSETPFVVGTTPSSHSNAQTKAKWIGQFPSNFNSTSKNFTSVNTTGRYVLIQKSGTNDTGILTLAEVQVFGTPSPVYSCPGEIVQNINGATADATQSYTEHKNGHEKISRYFKFKTAVNGNITIHQKNNKPKKGYWSHQLKIGTSCNGKEIYKGPNSAKDSHTFAVAEDTTYYIRVREKNKKNALNFDIDFDFTADIAVNNPPTFTSTPPTTVNDNVNYTYTPSTNDIDGDTVTVTAITRPDWLSFNGTTLSGVPGVANIGDYPVTLSASDGNGGTILQTFNIRVVTSQNGVPVFTSTPITTVLINNTYNYLIAVNDPNGDTVTVSVADPSSLPPGVTLTGNTLSGIASTAGDYNVSLIANDGHGGTDTQNFTISVNPVSTVMGGFIKKFSTNIQGNLKVIGNTVLNFNGTIGTDANSQLNLTYVNIDSDPNTWNSSSANIQSTEGGVDISNAKIVWAGLYWQSYLHTWDTNDGGDTNNQFTTLTSLNSINTVIDNHSIILTSPAGSFSVSPQQTGKNQIANLPLMSNGNNYNAPGYNTISYSCFADVTNLLQSQSSPVGTYTVANIPTQQGKTAEHSPWEIGNTFWFDGLGNYGAWVLVVVYANTSEALEKTRNLSVFDGFTVLSAADNPTQTINFSGFKTPRVADTGVDSTLSVFAAEGDKYILGDYAKLINENNNSFDLPNATGTDSYFASAIEGVPVRKPIISNNNGIDIHTTQVGTSGGNEPGRIGLNQTSASITLGTTGDTYMPSMVAFATELYQPEVCYDFVAKRNEVIIPYKDHTGYEAYAEKDDEISFTIAIWDIKGDVDPRYVSLGLSLTSQTKGHISPKRNPDKAYYTFKNGNTLLPTDYAVPMTTSRRPVITIGEGRTPNVGGTIRPDEQYYSKFYFEVDSTNNGLISGDYQVDVNATFNYGGGDFWQLMPVTRCPQTDSYTPTWVQFNVEKVFPPSSVPTDATEHYSLPTRVAGKDFDYTIASYTKSNDGKYTAPVTANGITVDVEMIDINAFDDNNSQFKCGNSDPAIIVMPGNFIHFDNNETRHNVINPNDLRVTYPLRNATFRMWLLADENGTLTSDANYHAKNANAYFAQLYTNTFKDRDVKGFCKSACTSPYNYDSPRFPDYDLQAQGCYACLRDFFAQPYCARDNFAIRPKAIKVTLNDRDKDGKQTSSTIAQNDKAGTPDNNISIAAGYNYEMIITTIDDQDKKAIRYYTTDEFESELSLTSIPSKPKTNSALVKFEGNTNCADQTHKTLFVRFYDGEYTLDSNDTSTAFNIANVGPYSFEIWDSNFTLVDNASKNPNKTLFDPTCKNSSDPRCNDCIIDSTSADADILTDDKIGCIFSSDQAENDGYTKLNLGLNPYAYDLDVTLKTMPNTSTSSWLYMNNLAATAYTTATQRASSMAAVLEGNVSAIGANNNIPLSNYTTQCVAQDVTLWLDRNMSVSPESSIVTEDATPTQVGFEQWLYSTIPGAEQSVEDNMGNGDMNASLIALNFKNEDNGSAELKLYYNFNKPYNVPVNPINVIFNMLHAASPNAQSFANLQTNYIPDGNVSSLGNKWFLFAKVAPKIGDEYITTYDSAYTTYLRVNNFCINKSGINCSVLQGLGILGSNEETITTGVNTGAGWYRASTHNKDLDGNVTLSANILGISELPVALTSISFENNGSTSDITLTYPIANARPKDFILTITPDEWLKYDKDPLKNGLPTFSIHYRSQGLRWKGEGDTGHVISTQPYSGENKRMNW